MNFPHPVLSDEHLPFPLVALTPSSFGSDPLISSSGHHSISPRSISTKLTGQSLRTEPEDFDKMLDMLGIKENSAGPANHLRRKEDVAEILPEDVITGTGSKNVCKQENNKECKGSGVSLGSESEDRLPQIRSGVEDSKAQARFVRHPSASSTSSTSQCLTTSSEPVRFPSYNSAYPSYPVDFGSPASPILYHRPHSVASDEPSLHENIFSRSHSSPRSTTTQRERHQPISSNLPSSGSSGPSSNHVASVLQSETRQPAETRPSLPRDLQSPMREIISKDKVSARDNLSELTITSDPLAPSGLPLSESTYSPTLLSSASSSSLSSPSSSSVLGGRQSIRSTHFSTSQTHAEASQATHNSVLSPSTSSPSFNYRSSSRQFKPRSISSTALQSSRSSSSSAAQNGSTLRSMKDTPQKTYRSSIERPSSKWETSVSSLKYNGREDEYEEGNDEADPDENEDEKDGVTEEREEFLNRPLGLLALSHALAAANEEVDTLRSVVRDVNALVTDQAAVLLTSRYLPNHPHLLQSTSSTSLPSRDPSLMRDSVHGPSASMSKIGRKERRDEDWLSLSKEEIDEFSGAEARKVLKAITSPKLGLASTIAFLRHIELRLNPLLEGAPPRSDDDVFSEESFQRMDTVLDSLILGQRQKRGSSVKVREGW